MFKQNILFSALCATVVAISFSLSSCQKLSNNEVRTSSPNSKELTKEKASKQSYELLRSIYVNAFDGQNIDVEKFEQIVVGGRHISSSEFEKLASTSLRSADDPAIENLLSTEMLEIYNSMIALMEEDKELSDLDEKQLLDSAYKNLSGQERADMIAIIEATKLTIDGINKLNEEFGADVALRGRKDVAAAVGRFACNMASGGIGSVWGSMAGGIALAAGAGAILTGGVSVFVGLAVGAAISTIAC